jgi:hypothetical protein
MRLANLPSKYISYLALCRLNLITFKLKTKIEQNQILPPMEFNKISQRRLDNMLTLKASLTAKAARRLKKVK